jgi:hypothetical protein
MIKRRATEFDQQHNLPGLWKEFETLCGLLDWEWETEYEACGDIIMELHEKDPALFCFRYPITMSGEPALEQEFRFDLQNFYARMDDVLGLLDRVDCGPLTLFGTVRNIIGDGSFAQFESYDRA